MDDISCIVIFVYKEWKIHLLNYKFKKKIIYI